MNNRLISPSSDFRSVRDGRNSQIFYLDIDLTNARTASAATGLVLNISGNAFYCDANPSDGNAFVHFQDTNFDRAPAPLYVSPGVIFNIPFTQILIENTAQPGKKIRICYGIDVDFQPGSVAQIAVTNAGGFTAVRPEAPTGFYGSKGALAANTPDTVFLAGANPNGAILLGAAAYAVEAAGGIQAFVANSVAPATTVDGDVVHSILSGNGSNSENGNLSESVYIPAGKGLYFISDIALTVTNQQQRSARYKLL